MLACHGWLDPSQMKVPDCCLPFVFIGDALSDKMKKECEGMPRSLLDVSGSEKTSIHRTGGTKLIEAPVEAFNDQYMNPIYNIVLLRMVFDGKTYQGTGIIICSKSNDIY